MLTMNLNSKWQFYLQFKAIYDHLVCLNYLWLHLFQLTLTYFPLQVILISTITSTSWFLTTDTTQITKLLLVNMLNNQVFTKMNSTFLLTRNTIPFSKTSLYSFLSWTFLNHLYDNYVHLLLVNSITNHSLNSALLNILHPLNTQTSLILPHS